MTTKATGTNFIHLRAAKAERAPIDRAAEAVGKSRSDFVVDAATQEARLILVGRLLFHVNVRRFNQVAAALDSAPIENPRLRQLLSRRAPWERRARRH
jgi:uncharacterized protein (DUF1778 family)